MKGEAEKAARYDRIVSAAGELGDHFRALRDEAAMLRASAEFEGPAALHSEDRAQLAEAKAVQMASMLLTAIAQELPMTDDMNGGHLMILALVEALHESLSGKQDSSMILRARNANGARHLRQHRLRRRHVQGLAVACLRALEAAHAPDPENAIIEALNRAGYGHAKRNNAPSPLSRTSLERWAASSINQAPGNYLRVSAEDFGPKAETALQSATGQNARAIMVAWLSEHARAILEDL